MPLCFSRNIAELEAALGYHFRNAAYLEEAVTHKSYQHEHAERSHHYNERLEFLGDSVLGLTVAETLFSLEASFTEADMSKLKAHLVNKTVLHDIGRSLQIGHYMRLGKGEESTQGRQKQSILANAVEALIGAIFLDSGYPATKEVILRIYGNRISDAVTRREWYDYKSALQEHCQGAFGVLPDYRVIKQEGQEHKKVFTIEVLIQGQTYGRGVGKSKKDAQMAAAREALSRISLQ
ncbi:MAG TPA: ribonuclease III [Dissulfurispiraceae bacterium]|nr:ribonuclease III [Dissulfurispiraceae bacterium]